MCPFLLRRRVGGSPGWKQYFVSLKYMLQPHGSMTFQLQAAAETSPQTRGVAPRRSQEILFFEKKFQPQIRLFEPTGGLIEPIPGEQLLRHKISDSQRQTPYSPTPSHSLSTSSTFFGQLLKNQPKKVSKCPKNGSKSINQNSITTDQRSKKLLTKYELNRTTR